MNEESSLSRKELLQEVKAYVSRAYFKSQLELNGSLKVSFLAQGEYNLNFLIEGENKKVVLRLNTGSQMGLENQIKYEYRALEYLAGSGVTPRPLLVDDREEELPFGMLVMDYLPGRAMDYRRDLNKAAEVLAEIHSVEPPENHQLIREKKPLSGIWQECSDLVPVYLNSELGKSEVKKIIAEVVNKLDKLREKEQHIMGILPESIVNTEVNSGNFIIDEKAKSAYLVDWEKPLLTTPLQDLSHFMVATTTLWKTDYRLEKQEQQNFIKTYSKARGFSNSKKDEIIAALEIFNKFSLLRGISWSAMAWVEYQKPGRALKNKDTFAKMDNYLEEGFLQEIFQELI